MQSGVPTLVAEFVEAPARFAAVRVTGRLAAYCAVANVAELEHRGATVRVKTANLEHALEFHLERLYSFIGEVERCDGRHGTVLHACRVVKDRMEIDANVRQTVHYLEKQLLR